MGFVDKTVLYGAGLALVLLLVQIATAGKTLKRDGKPLRWGGPEHAKLLREQKPGIADAD